MKEDGMKSPPAMQNVSDNELDESAIKQRSQTGPIWRRDDIAVKERIEGVILDHLKNRSTIAALRRNPELKKGFRKDIARFDQLVKTSDSVESFFLHYNSRLVEYFVREMPGFTGNTLKERFREGIQYLLDEVDSGKWGRHNARAFLMQVVFVLDGRIGSASRWRNILYEIKEDEKTIENPEMNMRSSLRKKKAFSLLAEGQKPRRVALTLGYKPGSIRTYNVIRKKEPSEKPSIYREKVRKLRAENLANDEIARVLGKSVSTVEKVVTELLRAREIKRYKDGRKSRRGQGCS